MTHTLVQYVGNLNPAAFQARALEGANNNGDGMIIVTAQGEMFLYGNDFEVIKMIKGFPEAQSFWAASQDDEAEEGSEIIESIRLGLIKRCSSFRPSLQLLFRQQ